MGSKCWPLIWALIRKLEGLSKRANDGGLGRLVQGMYGGTK